MLAATFFDNTLLQSLLYCYLALSVYLSLRILDFPDLTIEGSFPLGAAHRRRLLNHLRLAALGGCSRYSGWLCRRNAHRCSV